MNVRFIATASVGMAAGEVYEVIRLMVSGSETLVWRAVENEFREG